MHYHAEVYLRINEDIESQIDEIMAPYEESLGGFYDWFQIGGRWTGIHGNYKPEGDPRNIEECSICNGTGFRNDSLGKETRLINPSYTCNGCGEFNSETNQWEQSKYGKGKRLKWPTQWADHESNVISISEIPDDFGCYTLIVDGQVFHKEGWDGDKFIETNFNLKQTLEKLGIIEGYLVTVDYHC